MIKFYGYKKCGTCRKAEKSLQTLALDYTFIDITENPPAAAALKRIASQADVDLSRLFNTSGVQYRELKIKDRIKHMSADEMLALLAANGRLIKRPLVTDGKRSTVGYREETFNDVWGKTA